MNRIGNRIEMVGRGLSSGLLGLAALALGAGLLPRVAWADDAALTARAVRLSTVDGQVRLLQGNLALADQAVANTPLFEGTNVATEEDGRAEIQLEDGSVARLSPNSALTLSVLRGQGATGEAEITLVSGLGYFEIQGGGQAGAIRIRFGDSVVTASGFTVMRINMDTPPGELAVFSGNAHLERGTAPAVDLHGGESVALNGADPTRYDLTESIEPDSWDSWNSDRDQVLAGEASSKTGAAKGYADSGNPAWNDLDANGSWYNVPGQGNIWSPYAASSPGFDPYGSGYWMWTPRYGYIWVSGYSWGYMPFQCGAWNYYDNFGWGWMPGMNGCMPWWGSGYYGPNIGTGYGGYRPPIPPRPRPRPPWGHGNRPGPYPLVAITRHSAAGNTLPLRDRTGSVVIAGHTVQPFRPLNPRPVYSHSASSFVNRTPYPGAGSEARMAGGQAHPAGPTVGAGRQGTSGNSSGSFAARPSGGSSHTSSASHGSSSGGSSAGHSSGGGGYSGGGGGGASHAGGGSSGGGGASSGGGSHR
jgi:hypothetical protein